MRVIVDRARCFGFGRCADEVPEVFSLDDEGLSVPGDPGEVDLTRLRAAAVGCPRQAIRVVGDQGNDLVDVLGATSGTREGAERS
jgi:ferredoxin